MEKIQNKFAKAKPKAAKSQYLHSPNHLLADELSQKFHDPKHFGFYLKTAISHDHAVLRRLAGEVLESKTARNPAKLFSYLVKKLNQETKSPTPSK